VRVRSRFPRWGLVPAALPWLWFAVRGADGPIDLIAVALPALGAISFLAAVVLVGFGRTVAGATASSVFLVCVVASVEPRLPIRTQPSAPGITLISTNVLGNNPSSEQAAAAMTARMADVIVAVEVGPAFARSMDAAADDYPYSSTTSAQSVWSRWPVSLLPTPGPLRAERIARFAIDADGVRFVVYAVHLLNPLHQTSFHEQLETVERLLASIEEETDPVILAGDLNLSDRSAGYRLLEGSLLDAMRTGWWAASTYRYGVWRPLSLRIDHLFVPSEWCAADARTFGLPGSDHLGVETTVGPCPP
jgi:endonuclease/exonuclease/phosphatase (EEP) superfamily protein YafD